MKTVKGHTHRRRAEDNLNISERFSERCFCYSHCWLTQREKASSHHTASSQKGPSQTCSFVSKECKLYKD